MGIEVLKALRISKSSHNNCPSLHMGLVTFSCLFSWTSSFHFPDEVYV